MRRKYFIRLFLVSLLLLLTGCAASRQEETGQQKDNRELPVDVVQSETDSETPSRDKIIEEGSEPKEEQGSVEKENRKEEKEAVETENRKEENGSVEKKDSEEEKGSMETEKPAEEKDQEEAEPEAPGDTAIELPIIPFP